MCGRFVLYGPDGALADWFGAAQLPAVVARWNIAPTAQVLAVVQEDGQRAGRPARWGLIPHWAQDASIGAKLNNARAETVATKPSFRTALRRSRCLIPANGFYEWQAVDVADGKPRKQPYYVHPLDAPFFAFAGLMERWRGPDGVVQTCCIITGQANATMAPIHDRMPMTIAPERFDAWLDPALTDAARIGALLQQYPAERMAAHPVAAAVSNPRREGPALIEPVEADAQPAAGGQNSA